MNLRIINGITIILIMFSGIFLFVPLNPTNEELSLSVTYSMDDYFNILSSEVWIEQNKLKLLTRLEKIGLENKTTLIISSNTLDSRIEPIISIENCNIDKDIKIEDNKIRISLNMTNLEKNEICDITSFFYIKDKSYRAYDLYVEDGIDYIFFVYYDNLVNGFHCEDDSCMYIVNNKENVKDEYPITPEGNIRKKSFYINDNINSIRLRWNPERNFVANMRNVFFVLVVALILEFIITAFYSKKEENTKEEVEKRNLLKLKEKKAKKIINRENLKNRRNHFNNLKENVLKLLHKHLLDKPILGEEEYICEVYINKSTEIDETLFKDIKNHFPHLIEEWDNLNSKYEEHKKNCKNFVDEVLKIIKKDTSIEKVYGWSAKFIYEKILGKDTKLLEPNPILEDYDYNTIKSKSHTYMYARDSKKENLEKFMSSCDSIIKSDTFCEKAKSLDNESKTIKMMAEKFKEKLNEIIHSERLLVGKCKYI
ncbi:hypothetical protein COV19_05655 [Candidatus Woesearchaeota archaeon CG10_big_fil_rev_8_21_14_0_10_44_13]|nr:MAG: hypothetical protein COV19_05655 [Candidatus Woesearchaeota archaeon CG10_big_fil_rev_8_21_14_0_10_44_13]